MRVAPQIMLTNELRGTLRKLGARHRHGWCGGGEHNDNPRSFVWTAKAETILEKVRRARAMLDKMQTV